MSKPELKVVLGRSPMDTKVLYGSVDLTQALCIRSIYVQPVCADQQDTTKVTMTITPGVVEIDTDHPQLVIDGHTFNLIPE